MLYWELKMEMKRRKSDFTFGSEREVKGSEGEGFSSWGENRKGGRGGHEGSRRGGGR